MLKMNTLDREEMLAEMLSDGETYLAKVWAVIMKESAWTNAYNWSICKC